MKNKLPEKIPISTDLDGGDQQVLEIPGDIFEMKFDRLIDYVEELTEKVEALEKSQVAGIMPGDDTESHFFDDNSTRKAKPTDIVKLTWEEEFDSIYADETGECPEHDYDWAPISKRTIRAWMSQAVERAKVQARREIFTKTEIDFLRRYSNFNARDRSSPLASFYNGLDKKLEQLEKEVEE